jgi:hypothetical protein
MKTFLVVREGHPCNPVLADESTVLPTDKPWNPKPEHKPEVKKPEPEVKPKPRRGRKRV